MLTTVILGIPFIVLTFHLYYSNEKQEPVVPEEIGQYDSMLGWSLKPYSIGTSKRTGKEIEYSINSKGLRDNETTYEKPKNIFRIVLLGDSRTFGYGVPIEKHFSTLIEKQFKDVEVINIGIQGFGIDQELLYLKSEGFKYNPDLVLAYVSRYGNHRHMHTERFGKNKPRFLLVDDKLVLINSPPTSSKIDYSKEEREMEDKKNLENDTFRKELFDLGEAIVSAMYNESLKHEANFVLVTQIKELHGASVKKHILSLDVNESLSDLRYRLPNGLQHINELGNDVLASEIVNFLKNNKLVPNKHFK